MEECKKNRQWDALIDVLKESILLDTKDAPGFVRDYHLMLKDAYLQAGRMDDYRKELWLLVTNIVSPFTRGLFSAQAGRQPRKAKNGFPPNMRMVTIIPKSARIIPKTPLTRDQKTVILCKVHL
ncbi:MAG: hypothetical protein IK099_01805 [Clostridia bacterium]|nr:hypothetical protein [Clostridia bacterium]